MVNKKTVGEKKNYYVYFKQIFTGIHIIQKIHTCSYTTLYALGVL